MKRFAILLALAAPCAYAADVNDVKQTVEQRVFEITGKDMAVLSFAKGSANLTSSDETNLKATVDAMRETGPVKEILVLAYGDADYPHNQKDDLNSKQVDLASKRSDIVEKKLKDIGAEHVTAHNMAKKANWFEKTFVTSDAQVKREAAEKPSKADADDQFYQALGQKLRHEGGAGKVVVVVRHEGSYAH